MTRRQYFGLVTLTSMIALAVAMPARAATKASDNASNAAYAAEVDGAWKGTYDSDPPVDENPPGTDNGGTGFLPWNFTGGNYVFGEPYDNLNHFIDGVDFPTTTYNNLGTPAFGLGNVDLGFSSFITTTATRPFAAAMEVGDVFSADFDSPAEYVDLSPDDFGVAGYPFAIIGFTDAAGQETFNIEAGSSSEFGDFPWRYDDGTVTNGDYGVDAGGDSIAPTDTSDGSHFSLEITDATTGHFIFDGVSLDIQFVAGLPKSVFFILFDNDADDDGTGNPTGEHAFYFDNLKIESGGAAIPGDFDGNGHVEGADLIQWKGDFGIDAGSNADGDTDSDGNDLLIWQKHLGDPQATPSVGAVPEPASIVIALGAVCALARRRGL